VLSPEVRRLHGVPNKLESKRAAKTGLPTNTSGVRKGKKRKKKEKERKKEERIDAHRYEGLAPIHWVTSASGCAKAVILKQVLPLPHTILSITPQ
jgi:hypothetical protein